MKRQVRGGRIAIGGRVGARENHEWEERWITPRDCCGGSVRRVQARAATTVVWDGGTACTDTDLGTAANWNTDTLPASRPAIPRGVRLVGGDLSLVYSNSAFAGAISNPGLTLNLTAAQAGAVSIDSGSNQNTLCINAITIAAGAGAFTLGDNLGTFKVGLGGNGRACSRMTPATSPRSARTCRSTTACSASRRSPLAVRATGS